MFATMLFFLEILQSLRIELSPNEFERLAVKYDIKNTGRLSYPDFLRHFVLMFGPQVNTSTYRLKLQLPRTPVSFTRGCIFTHRSL